MVTTSSISGFDWQFAANDNIQLGGNAAYSTTQRRGPVGFSIRCNPASGASSNVLTNASAGGSNYVHFGLYIATLPSLERVIFSLSGVSTDINVRLTSTGTLTVYVGTTLIGTSVALATGQWYWIGIRQTGGTSVVFLQIDGQDAVSGTAASAGSDFNRLGFTGTEASDADIYFDDFIGTDDGFVPPSYVALAVPVSDNTVTGATDNNGATTNLWQGVSNIPPAGVASANEAANPKKGIHFPASTVSNYVANLTSYAALGISPNDTVLGVQPMTRCGEDIATGSKNLTLSAMTNPTIAGALFFLGNGAHGAEPGLWQTAFNNVLANPTVTLTDSPTLAVSRASEARLACVDAMGANVAWTPNRVPYISPLPPIIAR